MTLRVVIRLRVVIHCHSVFATRSVPFAPRYTRPSDAFSSILLVTVTLEASSQQQVHHGFADYLSRAAVLCVLGRPHHRPRACGNRALPTILVVLHPKFHINWRLPEDVVCSI